MATQNFPILGFESVLDFPFTEEFVADFWEGAGGIRAIAEEVAVEFIIFYIDFSEVLLRRSLRGWRCGITGREAGGGEFRCLLRKGEFCEIISDALMGFHRSPADDNPEN